MCGICGFLSDDSAVSQRETIDRMVKTLKHRGPDANGVFTAPGVALGHTRLKIIDLEGGQQPFLSDDRKLVLVYNGEIYNFRELRDDLTAKGHSFRTRSDTEVLFKLYQQYGTDCLQMIRGMFAFAFWDSAKELLWGARDRMGVKPLYYFQGKTGFVFASELKALVAHPSVTREISLPALQHFLFMDYIPAPGTIFKGIQKLAPGFAFKYQHGIFSTEPFWQMTFPQERSCGEQEVLPELRQKLERAVERRLVGDVPLGVLLSGGIDSSAVLASIKALGRPAPATFTISFPEASFDESAHARKMAGVAGAAYHEEQLTASAAAGLIENISAHMDEPLADPSLVPTWLLASLARKHSTFVLGGDGGDELFGGYPAFQMQKLLSLIGPLEGPAGTIARGLAGMIRPSAGYKGINFVLNKFISGAGLPLPVKHLAWLGSFAPAAVNALTAGTGYGSMEDNVQAGVLAEWKKTEGLPVFKRLQHLYFRYYLAEGVLVKVERASMAHSLEVRSPFLDYDLVNYVNSIPDSLKMKGLTTKYILKRCFEGSIPDDILRRPKQGFAVPLAKWLRENLRTMLLDELNPARIRAQGIFEPAMVERYVREHLAGEADHRKRLWSLLMFQLWEKKWNHPS